MESNLSALGNLLNGQMRRVQTAGTKTLLELGKINDDLSLSSDSLTGSIPTGEYMVSLHLKNNVDDALTTLVGSHAHSGGTHAQQTGSGAHTHSDGDHAHGLPQTMRGIKPGDRVLIAWVGVEPVVVDIVVSG